VLEARLVNVTNIETANFYKQDLALPLPNLQFSAILDYSKPPKKISLHPDCLFIAGTTIQPKCGFRIPNIQFRIIGGGNTKRGVSRYEQVSDGSWIDRGVKQSKT
jgi:hypothetical protein